MVTIQRSLLIEAPAAFTAAFWNDFQRFPMFMEDLVRVVLSPSGAMSWHRNGHSSHPDVDVHLTDREEARLLAWRYGDGPERAVRVTFSPLAGDATWLTYTLDYELPQADGGEDEVAAVGRRINRDLRAARDIIETQYYESRVAAGARC